MMMKEPQAEYVYGNLKEEYFCFLEEPGITKEKVSELLGMIKAYRQILGKGEWAKSILE